MDAPKSPSRAAAAALIVSLLCLLAVQAPPLAGRGDAEMARAGAPGFREQVDPGGSFRKGSRLLPSLLGLVVAGAVVAVLVLTVFKKTGYNPHIIPQDFVQGVDHPHFPIVAGQVRSYAVNRGEANATLSVTSTANSKMIMGVLCVGIHDQGRADLGRTEDTWRWYAQDEDGDVWCFAEETRKYSYADLIDEWSWQAGSGGAKPGIVMPARPLDYLGKEYILSFAPGVAEDKAQVLGTSETVTVPCGTFSGCVQVRVYSDLEPGREEHRFFAPGIGLVLAVSQPDGIRRLELVSLGNE